jgi:hypothetical protein
MMCCAPVISQKKQCCGAFLISVFLAHAQPCDEGVHVCTGKGSLPSLFHLFRDLILRHCKHD